jgi:hypothetical protein
MADWSMLREAFGSEAFMPQYAYSLNGENWQGAFATRETALQSALQKCSGVSDPPGTVFVAEIPASEAFADHLGHALIKEMCDRAVRQGNGDTSVYLHDVTAAQLDQLDEAIELVLMRWLQTNALLPESAKVRSISEHPVPLPHRALDRQSIHAMTRKLSVG